MSYQQFTNSFIQLFPMKLGNLLMFKFISTKPHYNQNSPNNYKKSEFPSKNSVQSKFSPFQQSKKKLLIN
jgi:hypothetical protein